MTISMYEPRTMALALEKLPPARNFLKRTFFSRVEEFDTEKVDVDIQIGTRRVAPYVNPMGPGKVVDRQGFTTSTYTAPLVAPKRPITIQDIQTRLPGEHIYAATDPDARQQRLLAKDLQDLDTMIARREEIMCRDAAVSSAIVVLGDDVSYTITYARDASLTKGLLAAADRWSAATADIYGQLLDWSQDIEKLYGTKPDTLILSNEAAKAFLSNTENRAKLNTLHMNLGDIAPQPENGGASLLGEFAGTGIKIWTYAEWYLNDTGVLMPMIPAKTILLGSTMAQTSMRYGAVGVTDEATQTIGLVPRARVPESWVTREPSVRWLKVSSRPLPVPTENAFLTAQIIA